MELMQIFVDTSVHIMAVLIVLGAVYEGFF